MLKSYYTKLFDDNRHNLNGTWEVLNEIIGKSKVSSSEQYNSLKDGVEITDDVEVADCFNDYFSSIGNSLANSIPLVDEPLS